MGGQLPTINLKVKHVRDFAAKFSINDILTFWYILFSWLLENSIAEISKDYANFVLYKICIIKVKNCCTNILTNKPEKLLKWKKIKNVRFFFLNIIVNNY